MTEQRPPRIFARPRRAAARRRAIARQQRPEAARFVLEDMAEDVLDRIGFVRLQPGRALVIGDMTGSLAGALQGMGWTVENAEPTEGFDEEQPYSNTGFDLIASLGTLDTLGTLDSLGALQVPTQCFLGSAALCAAACGVKKFKDAMGRLKKDDVVKDLST